MKRTVILILALLAVTGMLLAQQKIVIKKTLQGDSDVSFAMGDDDDLEELAERQIVINLGDDNDIRIEGGSAAFFGIFVEDISFPKAQALSYTENYGIILTGVSPNSPAWESRLQEDDIIMQINDEMILNTKVFDKYRATLRAGDKVMVKIFRSGKIIETEIVLGSRESKVSELIPGEKPKKKLSAGYGGGTYNLMYFTPDMEDVNEMMTLLGFDEQPEDGVLMQGIVGKGPIGKGFFIGGYVVGYEDTQKKAISDLTTPGTKWLRYSTTMGGVTLDKRVPFSSKFIGSVGLTLGGGSHNIEVTRTHGNYPWDDFNENTNFTNYNMSRSFIIAQPKAEVMYRLLSWLAFRAEVGYTYGYSPTNRWKINGFSGEEFVVSGSPNTEFQGLNVCVGPWFGF